MFVISRKCRYGIEAMLTLAEYHGRGLLQIKDIVADTRIPRQYLEQIFNRLVKAGLVRSVRGKNGGYAMAEPPDTVTVLQIVEVLEGTIEVPDDMASSDDAIGELFANAAIELRKILNMPLVSLVERQQKLRKNSMYFI